MAWASDGAVVRRVASQTVTEYVAPAHLGLAVAGAEVWLWDAESVWRLDGGTLWPVAGVTGAVAVAVSGTGEALVATAQGLLHVTVGEPPEVRVPRWSGDVLPLYQSRCDACHGPRGTARRLDDVVTFASQIDLIVAAVRDGRMPLPPNDPLTAAEIDLIERWRDAEFPE